MPRFLHTADWQIGRHYSRFADEDAFALAEERFAAVGRLAELARDESCDAVLVAGDVFDLQTVSDRTIRRLFNALEPFDGPWVLLPGNHDAALAESVWTRADRLRAIPENVHVVLEPGVTEFPERGIAVLAAPLTQRHTYDDLTQAFDGYSVAAGLLKIGIAHGSVEGILAEDIDSTNPIAADRAERSGLDYLALGDWHGTKEVNLRTWYSGTPEPERFRNNQAGFALVVDIPEPGAEPIVEQRRVGRHEWVLLRAHLAVPTDLDGLLNELEGVAPESVVDVQVNGEVTLLDEARLTEAISVASALHRSLRCDTSDMALVPTAEDIAELQADGYLGETIEELREQQSSREDAVVTEALGVLAGILRDRQREVAS